MIKCTNCDGGGLVGAGDQPWLKQGSISTCPACSGKGQVADPSNVSFEETQNRLAKEAVNEPANLDQADAGGDSGNDSAPADETVL